MPQTFDRNDGGWFLLLQGLGWSALASVVHAASATWLTHTAGALPWQIVVRAAFWALLGTTLSTALVWPYRKIAADVRLSPTRLALLCLCAISAGALFSWVFDTFPWPLSEEGVAAMRAARTKASWARAISPSLAMLAWSATWVGSETGRRLRAERERALRAEALAVEARLAMLRYELNPHFLFNALNSIVGAIDESPARAKEMVRQLAGLLRHSLHGSGASSTLASEVEVAKLYLALEQARFEERLQVYVQIAPGAESWPMQAMLLQPLVENAVKHGMRTGPLPLVVVLEASIERERLVVVVTNTGRLTTAHAGENQGVGLRNLRDRLVHLDGASFALRQKEDRVEARLELSR